MFRTCTTEPFLDHELVEFARRVPPSLKIKNGQNKRLLHQYVVENSSR